MCEWSTSGGKVEIGSEEGHVTEIRAGIGRGAKSKCVDIRYGRTQEILSTW